MTASRCYKKRTGHLHDRVFEPHRLRLAGFSSLFLIAVGLAAVAPGRGREPDPARSAPAPTHNNALGPERNTRRLTTAARQIGPMCAPWSRAPRPPADRAERRLCAQLLARQGASAASYLTSCAPAGEWPPAWLLMAVSSGQRPVLPHRARARSGGIWPASADRSSGVSTGIPVLRRSPRPVRCTGRRSAWARSICDITLSDGASPRERAPTRRSGAGPCRPA